MTPEWLADLLAPCDSCGHAQLSHAISRGVRRHCCFGTAKFNCECTRYISSPPRKDGETGAGELLHRAKPAPVHKRGGRRG